MTKKRERPRVELVYYVGNPDGFAEALEETVGAMCDDGPGLKIQTVSHAIAIDAAGRTHYSAIIVAKP